MGLTQREATELAERIVKTWPTGPKQGIWFDVLGELGDYAIAWATYVHLRDTVERAPSIAAYKAEYRRRLHDMRGAPPPRTCPSCDGSGMRSAQQRIGLHTYDVVVACADCGAGKRQARVLHDVDQFNATHSGGERRRDVGLIEVDDTVRASVDGPVPSFTEYIARLTWRAGTGDIEAIEMLDVWDRNIQRGAVFAR